ncbi:group I truncated hemoglobin [Flavobacterium cellulosilyticum]|uniref:Group 1 truncated hemoglobin n=1 Tax=Flavobacterium cellulosilyticum TaxID=2541731 RepID=A0A4R5CJ97_9FLAO|nr:group 1 truncated hemoglobin [Flavobacterium cellulosilyticum]TDD97462.1 group 1 truncated hemoglobin [Flavobacterium cellulosilyticum]
MENKEKQQSLFERLGAVDGITAIVDDVVEAHFSNPDIKARFLPLKSDPTHFAEVRQHLINFFIMGSGGPQNYSGKDMHTAHVGMNISQGEYMSTIDDIMGALDKNNIDEQSKKDVLAILYSLKSQMVGV